MQIPERLKSIQRCSKKISCIVTVIFTLSINIITINSSLKNPFCAISERPRPNNSKNTTNPFQKHQFRNTLVQKLNKPMLRCGDSTVPTLTWCLCKPLVNKTPTPTQALAMSGPFQCQFICEQESKANLGLCKSWIIKFSM